MDDDSNDTKVATGPPSILDVAIMYARYGLRVFPARFHPGNGDHKGPMLGYGWTELATDKINHVVEEFARERSSCGAKTVSMSPGRSDSDGFLAVDIDSEQLPPWMPELIPLAAINITRRGQHLIFRFPEGMTPGNTDTKFPTDGWGEVRGYGGYIIIAGPDRPGFDPNQLGDCQPFPHPDWLEPYGGGAARRRSRKSKRSPSSTTSPTSPTS